MDRPNQNMIPPSSQSMPNSGQMAPNMSQYSPLSQQSPSNSGLQQRNTGQSKNQPFGVKPQYRKDISDTAQYSQYSSSLVLTQPVPVVNNYNIQASNNQLQYYDDDGTTDYKIFLIFCRWI
jgi:hypothetical protein